MFEKRIIHKSIKNYELYNSDYCVYVSRFEDASLKEFIKSCESVINSNQGFLPVIVDSFGGQVYTLFGMIDFLENCGVPIITIAECKAISCGAILFSCGSQRYIGANATIMIHEVSNFVFDKTHNMQNNVEHTTILNDKIFSILDENTNNDKGFWKSMAHKNKNADLYLTAKQAKKYNLATHIGIPSIETNISIERRLVK